MDAKGRTVERTLRSMTLRSVPLTELSGNYVERVSVWKWKGMQFVSPLSPLNSAVKLARSLANRNLRQTPTCSTHRWWAPRNGSVNWFAGCSRARKVLERTAVHHTRIVVLVTPVMDLNDSQYALSMSTTFRARQTRDRLSVRCQPL